MRLLIIVICLILVCSGSDLKSATGANFLEIGIGSKAQGMADAVCGVVEDVTSIFYNPAGLLAVQKKEVMLGYQSWIFDTGYAHIGYAQPIKDMVLGINFSFLSQEPENIIDNDGIDTGKKMEATGYVLSAAFSKNFFKIKNGLVLKLIHQGIYESSFNSIAIDYGLMRSVYKNMVLGFALQNAAISSDYKLPMNFKFGIGYKVFQLLEHDLITDLDINIPIEEKIKFNFGAEYSFKGMFLLRTGYKLGYDSETFSFGAGVNYKFFSFDYALVPFAQISVVHSFSLKMVF